MKCLQCGIEFESKRATAKFCSPKCRVINSRLSVTDGLSVTAPKDLSVTFKFTTKYKPLNTPQDDMVEQYSKIRTAKYWYDVPLGAIPVYEKDWPKMPEYMNGRQYFLWWKNNFELNNDEEKGELGMPIIYNPYPTLENVTVQLAGEQSRRWGA